jgi:exportin-7
LIGKTCAESRKWPDLYKPISLCFNILRWSLVGKYVNFGVFDLYNDLAFNDAMSMYFQLLIQIPLSDMMVCTSLLIQKSYPKLTQSSILLFQVFASEQMLAMSDMDTQVFQYMMQFCAEALKSTDSSICSQVAISIDYCFSFIVKQKMIGDEGRREKSRPGEYLLKRTSENPGVVTVIMNLLLDLVFFEDHPSQWTFTRALLPLILANKEALHMFNWIVFRLLR